MDRPSIQGLLFVYQKGKAPQKAIRREVDRYCAFTGQDFAVVRNLISKGYLVSAGDDLYEVNPCFDQFKTDFGISLSRIGAGSGLYVSPIFPMQRMSPPDSLMCFALMPFREPFDALYNDHIRKAVEAVGLHCRRADELFGPRPIIDDIWHSILSARILVADLTGRNPNVFYEVGVAHTLGREVVLITQSMDDVPFDLRHIRCIRYDYTPRGAASLENELQTTLTSVLSIDSSVKVDDVPTDISTKPNTGRKPVRKKPK